MSKVYSTNELIDILATERQACLLGQRLNLAATPHTGNPVVDQFLKPEAFQKLLLIKILKLLFIATKENIWSLVLFGDKLWLMVELLVFLLCMNS